ncbi:MAG TPA: type II toxin-antitoxin system ParD family antitoxin [Pyrinomonadaceae bacterium]|nr:type II toxin-antitoxin system ParD family antitoxin [Pyrinomonadaceae bacterium]
MNVSLTKELESFVNELVASGMYYSASEVVRDGLRLLKEQETLKKIRVEELRAEILRGFEQSQNGESKPLDIEEIQRNGEKILKQKQNGE